MICGDDRSATPSPRGALVDAGPHLVVDEGVVVADDVRVVEGRQQVDLRPRASARRRAAQSGEVRREAGSGSFGRSFGEVVGV
jgi:hypothetical protein